VGVIAGTGIFATYFGARAWIAYGVTAVALICVILLPVTVPFGLGFAKRRFSVRIPDERIPRRVLVAAVIANVASWLLYGAAFLCLTRGTFDLASHSWIQHTAANATSYVMGYLWIPVPAGLGVREKTLQGVLVTAGMATSAQAVAVSLVSRLWLLIIQILPALIFLAYRRPPNEKDPAAG
jgi:uncharacterized membrane protein YbhN (UPF0104 family)